MTAKVTVPQSDSLPLSPIGVQCGARLPGTGFSPRCAG